MTVIATTCEVSLACNGILTEFDFVFPIFVPADLKVYKVTVATGEEEEQTITTHYTLEAADKNEDYKNGGTVTTVGAAWSADYKIRIVRDLSKIQSLSLEEGGKVGAVALMQAYDRAIMIMQEIANALKKPVSLAGSDIQAAVRLSDVVNNTYTNAYVVAGGQAAATKNTGWLKAYLADKVVWIPYWLNDTP